MLGYGVISVPQEPVTAIGIVVSLYLGFKTTSAYHRWWEARKIWGEITNHSRTWAIQSLALIDNDKDAHQLLVKRHIAWVVALANQLRATSRFKISNSKSIFFSRSTATAEIFTAKKEDYLSRLSETEGENVCTKNNPALQILRLQSEQLRSIFDAARLDNNRFVSMSKTLGLFNDCQGQCERIKNTPFPRQITYFGRIFAWSFIILLPVAFIDAFEIEAIEHNLADLVKHEYVMALVPFTMLVSWIFFMLEKISESVEDPFEWSRTDVPIATLARNIEIDLLELLGETETPPKLIPVAGIAY